jgi:lipoate-protein ligase B
MRKFENYYLGETDYTAGLAWQRQESDRVRRGEVARVLGLEHATVITLGKRGSSARDLKTPPEELEKRGIEVCVIDRGGEATLHSPGQLVVYPLVPLARWDLSVREYVDGLREVTRQTLAALGVYSFCRSDREPGLYTDKGKIAFFGVRVDRGVTSHGLSLNVRNDLSLFDHIVSCGVREENFDSLAGHDINASPLEIFELWCREFKRHFVLTAAAEPTNLSSLNDLRS